MKDIIKLAGGTVLGLAVLLGIVWAGQGSDFFMYKVFAPRFEEVRREVFENTPSYVQGKNTYLARLRAEYEVADGIQKEALRRLILSEAETIELENLTPGNRSFIHNLSNLRVRELP